MTIKHTVIYVPGLGDTNISGRQKLLGTWHYKNVSIEACSMNWQIDEPLKDKLEKLVSRIDELRSSGQQVSLIGESAGASAVINALKLRPESLAAVVLLCGKSQYPDRIGMHLRRKNPRLYESVAASHEYIQTMPDNLKEKVLNVHPIADPVVPVRETKIDGVRNAKMPSFGHATSIVFGMTIWSFRIVHFIRKQRRN